MKNKQHTKNYSASLKFTFNQSRKICEHLRFIDANKTIYNHDAPLWGVPVNERAPAVYGGIARTYKEVLGYYSALDSLLNINGNLTEEIVKEIHSKTFQGKRAGQYKAGINNIFFYGYENLKIKTTPPEFVKSKMSALITWVNEALQESIIHPLLIVSVFSYEFLCIHPFADGNGRVCRILMVLLLIKCGYDFIKCSSLENYFEDNRPLQYQCIWDAQTQRGLPGANIFNWALFILIGLRKLSEEVKFQQKQKAVYGK